MKKLLRRTLALALLPALLASCVQRPAAHQTNENVAADAPPPTSDPAFKELHDRYVREFLRRNPTVNTYLGGAGLDPALRETDGTLRDHSPAALEAEDHWLTETQEHLSEIDPLTLSPARRIDREVMLAQVRFLLRQHQVRRHQERALDTYVEEPFRAIDWQLQAMTQTGAKTYGTPEEWSLILRRVQAVPRYLQTAGEQLTAGIRGRNAPDHRVLRRHGLESTESNAKYFEKTLPELAKERLAAGRKRDERLQREEFLKQLGEGTKAAAAAYRDFRRFVAREFFEPHGPAPSPTQTPKASPSPGAKGAHKPPPARGHAEAVAGEVHPGEVKPQFREDRYAMGESEYNWALKNNLRLNTTAGRLYEESWPIVEETQREMIALAKEIAARRNLKVTPRGDGAAKTPPDFELVRAVFDELGKDYPKTDAEMIRWYEEAARRLVDYGRKSGMFDVPADYKLAVVETPPPLRASVDGAVYYPAPPFKQTGVGRFYVSPTGNDEAALRDHNRSALADLAAHEGFPGHDWHFKVMTEFRNDIAPARWLTPGSVEDSSSMWQDSMAMEGWGLYSEALLAEPQPGFPAGFYTPEERLYQLQGKLYRDLRVRIDTGLHTGRMTFDEAVDLFSEVVDFRPGSCRDAEALKDEDKRASCQSSERAIFRYSKWPTQAVTYRLGKDQIFELRREAEGRLGERFSPREFHLLFMKQGTIPAGYFRDELLREIQAKR
ncbi:MAG TPA: DUF885 domain-containing protein [Pyrinomonadaceae bacterium]|nr:DUF885 domain-containing protein [Pyrinomonadaceae bacterium]